MGQIREELARNATTNRNAPVLVAVGDYFASARRTAPGCAERFEVWTLPLVPIGRRYAHNIRQYFCATGITGK
jgi:hypothetical protein